MRWDEDLQEYVGDDQESQTPQPPPPFPGWVAPNSYNPNTPQDLAYWQSRGHNPDEMFDENGQIKPGWERTGAGYSMTGGQTAQPQTQYPFGAPIPSNTPFGNGDFGGGQRRPFQFQSLQWPDWAPPQFSAPPAFAYQDFKAPTLDDAINEPGYKFAADEGAKRIQNNAAARGNVVSGAAIKDLVKWSNDYATQNYNGVYGRGLQTWQSNRNNAADNYMTNYNVSRDVFDRSYNSYAAGDASRRQKAGLDFQRDWDIYQSDLDTKKYISGLGAN